MAAPAALQRLRQHAPLILSAAIVVLFALYLAGQISAWRALTREPVTNAVDAGNPAGAAPDLSRMETLFGTPTGQAYTPDASNSDLTLLGSFVNANPARSTAIIQLDGNPPQLYRVDQELEQGVRLHSVMPDSVEILRGGRVESLQFPTTRSAAVVPDNLTDYSDPAQQAQPDPQAEMLQQQMEALRQQVEGSDSPPDTPPSDEPPTEDN